MFTKKPISPSVSLRVRPAIGLPTTTSSCPEYRESRSCQAARTVMNSVAPWPRLSVRSFSDSSAGSARGTLPARASGTVGRGRSVGSSSTGGAPASRSLHQPSWASRTSPLSHSRCQAAKSAYCTGSSGSGSPA